MKRTIAHAISHRAWSTFCELLDLTSKRTVGAEIIGALVGVLPSAMMDSAMPDVPDADLDVDLDLDADAGPLGVDSPSFGETPGGFVRFLAWLSIGKVPALIILIVFLTSFGLIGLAILSVSAGLVGMTLPMIVTVPVAALAGLYPTRWAGGGLARVFRSAHQVVPSSDDFVGRIAVVTAGRAQVGLPAEAKLSDASGQAHYVRVEPEAGEFAPGTSVLLTKRVSSIYKAIPNPSEHLDGA